MNNNNFQYTQFALCREMMETIEIIKGFDPTVSMPFVKVLQELKNILLTGEGSSRLLPGKNFRDISLKHGSPFNVYIEGALQSMEYDLSQKMVFGVSNSGRTKEVISLFGYLEKNGHPNFYALSATPDSQIGKLAKRSVLLKCGKEDAVAATKSVVEQALFFESLFSNYIQSPMQDFSSFAIDFKSALELPVPVDIIEKLGKAPLIYFAGRNNGVAEELALKNNEITRKKSAYLQGTYALHGIEEVMIKGEVLIIIDPFEQEEQKFYDEIQNGAGVDIVAISSRDTMFPTIKIPENEPYKNYIELAAGWNLLVETGLKLDLDLDKPERARKIGNEA